MTARRDAYAILGVATEASDDDLDHAFRGLVRRLHPDTRGSATAAIPSASVESDDDADRRLQELLNAYATLRDPVRRAAYDRARVVAAPKPAVPDPVRGPAIRVGPVRWEPLRSRPEWRRSPDGS
ncbi:hypothetical protein GCM10009630_08860 [Kribbella jejuensis]|uniref:DnaJ-like protein n=1 Tax=Kribbella jejuensis TaxID=236068 RepID=A0A542EVH6_9ACTN|nr:DnaJ domain-containing protein [Kribbella jejuensis]TQJ19353.1 DnaJ-like protein [Kribbella jejuensis]